MLNAFTRFAAASFMLAAVAAASCSEAQQVRAITIQEPWAAVTNPGASVAGGYVTIRNAGREADRLLSASSPRAQRLELHEMSMTNGVMRMRPVEAIVVPAGGGVTLQPGGLHIMFLDIDAPFAEGQRIPVTLRFERAGAVNADFVARPRQRSAGHEH